MPINICTVKKDMEPTKDENYSEYRQRLVEQFKTILKGRADIRNIGIVREDKKFSISV